MNTWKVILATMVIFGTGVVTGGLLTWRLQRSSLTPRQRPASAPAAAFPGGQRLEFLRRVGRERIPRATRACR